MSRALEMFVYGVIAFAQLAVVLFLLERHAQNATPSIPAQAIQKVTQDAARLELVPTAFVATPPSSFTPEKDATR